MEDIGIYTRGSFTDLTDHVITSLFKSYPWEWIMDEEFGKNVPTSGVRFIEPPWKAVLSDKGLLPLLWEMFEGYPNLLPTYFEGDLDAGMLNDAFVLKPLLSRQGANIEIVQGSHPKTGNDGPYGGKGHIIQTFNPLPEINGNYRPIGCWLVASKAVEMCIREDRTLIPGKDACFIPHVTLN